MKDYKDFNKTFIGESDVGALIMVGCRGSSGLVAEPLRFGADDSYYGRIVDEHTAVPEHYSKVAEFNHWFKIYDDQRLTTKITADVIEVYQAGNFGVLIRVIGKKAE